MGTDCNGEALVASGPGDRKEIDALVPRAWTLVEGVQVQQFFDTLDHQCLRDILDRRQV